ncbi:hypothetical protein GCM10025880_33900 [Methylorubrum aminovorans]|nr:hypothetical protein GCM10025880_33900 [Methylorubrum aminovorans]
MTPPASVVTERRVVRWLLIAVALTFLGLFLVLPLLTVFAQALAKGWGRISPPSPNPTPRRRSG